MSDFCWTSLHSIYDCWYEGDKEGDYLIEQMNIERDYQKLEKEIFGDETI